MFYIFRCGRPNRSSNYTGSETTANVNSSNVKSVTVKAKWTLISYSKLYSYKNSAQTLEHPYEGYYKIELWGASGGKGYPSTIPNRGLGAYVSGSTKIIKSASLYIYTGESAVDTTSYAQTVSATFNGGGARGKSTDGDNDAAAAGGGATDIRTISGDWNNANSLRSRIIVAAGGGGVHYTACGTENTGSHGGGLSATGVIGMWGVSECISIDGKVNQTAGSSFGIGETGVNRAHSGSGGGGGWYGGIGGAVLSTTYGGTSTGGSSYISGHTGSVAVATTSSSSPKSGCTTGTTTNSCSISPYGYTFTNTLMIDGRGYRWTNTQIASSYYQMPTPSGGSYANGVGHNGNGYAKITWLGDTI